jgi:ABC-type uncharacterized transport system auxiliary subunit
MTHKYLKTNNYILLLLIFLTSCSLVLGKDLPAKTHYVLGSGIKFEKQAGKESRDLELRPTSASPLIDSVSILFSRTPSTRSEYQFAFWSEPPPGRFNMLLKQALMAAGDFRLNFSNARTAEGAITLNTQILDFYHDTTTDKPQVIVNISAVLSRSSSGETLDEKSFEKTIPLSNNNAQSAVQGFDQAIKEIIEEIIIWLRNYPHS